MTRCMGKIKNRLIKRTARTIDERGVNFSEDFEYNKKVLGKEMPSKKIRNQVAGYLTQMKKQEKAKAAKLEAAK